MVRKSDEDLPDKRRKRIWSSAARTLLFEALVNKFGPYDAWKKATSPGGGRDEEYREFLRMFAVIVGANSGEAVAHQIAFALPVKNTTLWEPGLARTAILSTAAAYESGFLINQAFPTLLAEGAKTQRQV